MPALERHELPADHGGVGGFRVGLVAPAAVLFMLGRHDEVDGRLGRPSQLFVVGQTVGFAEGDGGDAVRIHFVGIARPKQVAVGALGLEHPKQAVIDGFFVGPAAFVRLAGCQERQQAHGGGGRRRRLGLPGTGTGFVFALPQIAAKSPTAVFVLMPIQPVQRGSHRSL